VEDDPRVRLFPYAKIDAPWLDQIVHGEWVRPTWDTSALVISVALAGITNAFPGRDLGYAMAALTIVLIVVLFSPVRGLIGIPPRAAAAIPSQLKMWAYELENLIRKEPDPAKALERYHDEPYREGHPRSILGLALIDAAEKVGLATEDDEIVVAKPDSVEQAADHFREIATRPKRKRKSVVA